MRNLAGFAKKLFEYVKNPPDHEKGLKRLRDVEAKGKQENEMFRSKLALEDEQLLRNLKAKPTPPPDKSALPYYERINAAAAQTGTPQDILYRVLRRESMNFNPSVISGKLSSPVGAQGIAQFMPATAKGIGVDPLNVDQAIPASGKYLKSKFKQHGSWAQALAAYNAGSGNVYKYKGIPPFKETQDYVKAILEGLPYK